MEALNVLPRVPNAIGCRTHLRTFLVGSKDILFLAAINNSFFIAERGPLSIIEKKKKKKKKKYIYIYIYNSIIRI